MGLPEAIEAALDELEGVRRYTGEGGSLQARARCPFHDDHSPSFGLNLDDGRWNCLTGCGGGWITDLLLRLGFPRGHVAQLLEGYVRPARPDRLRKELIAQRQRDVPTDLALPEETLSMFRACPTALLEEGWAEETLDKFEVGYDRELERIIYPIRGWDSRLLLISGRSEYRHVWPKYLFYGENHLCDFAPEGYRPRRAQALYNVNRVLISARKHQLVPICEGFKEVMRLDMAGIPSVSLAGAMFSGHQLRLLNRLVYTTGCRLVVMLDNDKTGRKQGKALCRALLKFTIPNIAFTTDTVKDVSEMEDLNAVRRLVRNSTQYTRYLTQNHAKELQHE